MRLFFKLLLCFTVAAALLLSLLPSIASTEWGNRKLIKVINTRIDGTAQADSIQLSWLGPQTIKGLSVTDQGREILSVTEAVLDSSLFQLILKKIPGQLTLMDLNAAFKKSESLDSLQIKEANGIVKLDSTNALFVNLQGATNDGELAGNFDIQAQIDGFAFKDLIAMRSKSFHELQEDLRDNLKLTAEVNNFPVDLLDEALHYSKSEYAGILRSLLGEKVNFSIDQAVTRNGIEVTLHANSPTSIFDAVAIINGEGLSLLKPARLTVQVTPEVNTVLLPSVPLQKPVVSAIDVSEFSIPLESLYRNNQLRFDLKNLSLSAKLNVPQVELSGISGKKTLAFSQIKGTITAQKEEKFIKLSLVGKAINNEKPIEFSLGGTVKKPQDLNDLIMNIVPGIRLEGNLKGIPLDAAFDFLGIEHSKNPKFMSSILSIPQFAVTIDEIIHNRLSGLIEVKAISLSNQLVSLKDMEAKWELLLNPGQLSVEFNGISSAKESEGHFSGILYVKDLLEEGKPAFKKADVQFTTNLNQFPVAFLNMASPSYDLGFLGNAVDLKLEGNINFSNTPSGKADFYLYSPVISGNGTLESDQMNFVLYYNDKIKGKLDLSGKIEKLFAKDGSFNWNDCSLFVAAKARTLSVSLLSKIVAMKEENKRQLEALFGENINADAEVQLAKMVGPVDASVNGKNGYFTFNGRYADGGLYLNQPFIAEFVPNSALGKYVLESYFPLLSGILSAEQNIKLAINPEGFYFGLHPISLQRLKISSANLTIGKVSFSNEGVLNKAIAKLVPASINPVSIWFTPLYFSLIDGTVRMERIDMLLANQYPIAAWGNVDIINDKVGMIIALSGTAISKAFNISVPNKGYFVQLPLKGTLSSASIDKSKATAKISALAAQSQGGPHGVVIGTVLEIAGGKLNEEKAPNPTTNPLPWSQLLMENSEQGYQPSERTADKKVRPLKELERGADSLIKSLLR